MTDPNAKHDALIGRAMARTRRLRSTTVLPLNWKERAAAPLRENPVADGQIRISSEDEISCQVELKQDQLVLRPRGLLPGYPLSLVLGSQLQFWPGMPAVGEIEIPVTNRDQGVAAEQEPASYSLAADDGDRHASLDSRFQAATDDVRWMFDPAEWVFSLEARAADHDRILAILDIRAANDQRNREVLVVSLAGPRTTEGFLKTNLFDLVLEPFGPRIAIAAGPVDIRDPRHVRALLAYNLFVSVPLERQPDGTYVANGLDTDQKEAIHDAANGWAILTSAEGEVRS